MVSLFCYNFTGIQMQWSQKSRRTWLHARKRNFLNLLGDLSKINQGLIGWGTLTFRIVNLHARNEKSINDSGIFQSFCSILGIIQKYNVKVF